MMARARRMLARQREPRVREPSSSSDFVGREEELQELFLALAGATARRGPAGAAGR